MAPFNLFCLWFVKPPTANCVTCKSCDKTCPVKGTPSSRIREGKMPSRALDCVVCHDCRPACPKKDK
jgi:hypothetical protein